jgi:hypothetical protein
MPLGICHFFSYTQSQYTGSSGQRQGGGFATDLGCNLWTHGAYFLWATDQFFILKIYTIPPEIEGDRLLFIGG